MARFKPRSEREKEEIIQAPDGVKYKKISPEIIDEIRFFYIHHTIPISDLARQFDVNPNTLNSRKRREGWDLLRESALESHVVEKNLGIYSFKGESMDYWQSALDKCEDFLDEVSDIKEFKALIEARRMAEDRRALFARIELIEKKEEDSVAGILNQLANL